MSQTSDSHEVMAPMPSLIHGLEHADRCNTERQAFRLIALRKPRPFVRLPGVANHTLELLDRLYRLTVRTPESPSLPTAPRSAQSMTIVDVLIELVVVVEDRLKLVRPHMVVRQHLLSMASQLIDAVLVEYLGSSLLKPLNIAHVRDRTVVVLRIHQRGYVIHVSPRCQTPKPGVTSIDVCSTEPIILLYHKNIIFTITSYVWLPV